MKRILLLISLSIKISSAFSQGLQLDWVNGFNNQDGNSEGHIVIVDPLDNTYSLSSVFTQGGAVDIDPSLEGEVLINESGTVLAKFTPEGDYVWHVYLGLAAEGNFNTYGDVVIDAGGNVIIAGSFMGSVDFDPSENEDVQFAEYGALYFAKYSSDGQLLMRQFMPISSEAFFAINGLDLDSQQNIIIGGSIRNNGLAFNLDFDPSAGEAIEESADNGLTFISKYSSDGDFQFVEIIQGAEGGNSNRLGDLKVDESDNIWIAGEMTNLTDFDPSASEAIAGSVNKFIFLAKYSSIGEFILVNTVTGDNNKFARELAVDAQDNVYVAGEFTGQQTFSSTLNEVTLSSVIGSEPFIAKYTSDGTLIFAYDLNSNEESNSTNSARALTMDASGYFYIAGQLRRSCDFDLSEGEYIITPVSVYEGFIAKYDSNANLIWAFTSAGSSFTFGLDIGVNDEGGVAFTGVYRGLADFDPGEANTNTEGLLGNTMFIARYSPCYLTSDAVSICDGEEYQASTLLLSEAGSYNVSYLTSEGCDSIVQLQLTVNPIPDNSILEEDFTLIANQVGASYQWLNCADNQPIPFQNAQEFTPQESGEYAVSILLNDCMSTSECVNVELTDVTDIAAEKLLIYPNPSNGDFQMELNVGDEVFLYNSSGALVFSQSILQSGMNRFHFDRTGIYYMVIQKESHSVMEKIILLPN
ncbi:MAG: T9SS type A sorting domain-containing protein [Flavobacteriales bacterium]